MAFALLLVAAALALAALGVMYYRKKGTEYIHNIFI